MKRFSVSSILLGITLLLASSFLIVLGSDQQQINTDPIVDITPPSSSLSLSEQYKTKIYSSQSLRDEVMKRFQEYLRLPTQHPKPDYIAAVDYLLKWTSSIFHVDSADPIKEVQVNSNLKTGENSIIKYYIFHCNPAKPSFIFTWKGKDQSKGSIMINSHTDVVPVDKDQWKYSPFEATMVDENTGKGRRVYSRGSQDMKNIGTSYMEAITALVESGFKPERNLQVVFIADEEIGGSDGWECLIKNKELWKELNISFGLDEGLASGLDENIVPIYYGENVAHWFEITATGNVGHGSQFIQQTATEKIYKLLNEKVFPFREQQQVQMKIQTSNPREKTQCSTVVTINLTGLRAGHTNKESGEFSSPNVIPRTATALFDMRIPPHIDLKEIEIMLRSWADFVNGTIKFIEQPKINPVADLNDETVKKFLDIVNARMNTELRIFPAATDARFPRAAGVNMIGYSFMPNTKVLLHDHNEYLDENVYLDSIVHYIAILEGLLQN